MLFKRPTEEAKRFSVPVSDDVEASWESIAAMPLLTAEQLIEPEGELVLDVYVTSDEVVVKSTMAGVKPEDINVAFHNDLLTIRGRREEDSSGNPAREYVLRECHWGIFSRSVVLPVPVQPESASAVMNQGVLTIAFARALPTVLSVRDIEEDE